MDGNVGIGQAGHRARLGRRLHSAGLPEARLAYHDPIIEGAPGHGEGHNSGMPLNITAALALKKIMERNRLRGTILLWPGIAEEQLATKAYFVRAGVFKDVDVALFAHVGTNLGVTWGDGNWYRPRVGRIHLQRRKRPRGSCAVARAFRAGRCRVDGRRLESSVVSICAFNSVSHYVITSGGDQPNVVPQTAAVWVTTFVN